MPGGHCPGCLLRLALAEPESPRASSPSSARPETGRCLGDYELREIIASGGMGIVYRALQRSLNREVAVKMIRDGELANAAAVARFRSEAEAAAQLDHPNIVPIYEVNQQDGLHYFSMKLVPGVALSARLTSLGLRDSASLLSVVARAVHYAHQRGLLHRDLKPSNILIDADGQPHVTDFGLARRVDGDSLTTLSGSIVGTPAYMAPEQAVGAKGLTTAADVYSLGAVLYELLTGRPPFAGATPFETLLQVREREPVPPSAARARRLASPQPGEPAPPSPGAAGDPGSEHVDRDLEIICLKCLAKEPERRYGSAEALADDLDRWLEHRPILARPTTARARFLKWMRRQPALAALALSLPVVVLSGGAGVVWQWQRARAAAVQVREELWRAQLLEARSYRQKTGPGRRAEALNVIGRAAAHRPSIDLRDEAIATLVLPDLGSNVWWRSGNDPPWPITFTSDLQHFAGLTGNGDLAVWRETDAKPIAKPLSSASPVRCAQFSPDDSLLAAKLADGTIRVWRWRDQHLVLQTQSWPSDSEYACFDFSPDGREFWFLAADEHLARFSLPEGSPLPAPKVSVRAHRLRLDPTGGRLAAWTDNHLTAWDTRTGEPLGDWEAPADIWCLAWHPSGGRMAFASLAAGVHVAELGRKELDLLSSGPQAHAAFTRISFTQKGDFVLAGGWGDVTVMWNVATRQQELRSHSDWFQQVSRDGTRVAISLERRGCGVRTLELPIGIRRLRMPAAQQGDTWAAAWHPSGRWLLSGHQLGWVVWDMATGEPTRLYEGTSRVRITQFVPDGTAFLTGGDSGALLWRFDVTNGVPRIGSPQLLSPAAPPANERAVLSPDGRRFAAIGQGSWLGTVAGGHPPVPIEQGEMNTEVKFSPDGRWLALGCWKDTKVKIRDGYTGAYVTNLEVGTSGFIFSPKGDQIFCPLLDRVTIFEVSTWRQQRVIPFGKDWKPGEILCFWPDGSSVLAVNRDAMLQIWDWEANAPIATLRLPTEGAGGALISPGQLIAATVNQPWLDLWDIPALRRELARLGLDWPGDSPSAAFASRRHAR